MTDPQDKPTPPTTVTKGRLIVNVVLLILNLGICAYFFQQSNIILLLLFVVLTLRNIYIISLAWREG